MNVHRLEPILTYKMDEIESKAYRLGLLWEELASKEFPNDQHVRMKMKGDPRTSILFKYTFKLVKETKGILKDEEYQLYMLAQLQTMKLLGLGQELHPLIHPAILAGPKAWKRWRIWKERYDKEAQKPILQKEENIAASKAKICGELEDTKKFLTAKKVEKTVENYARLAKERLFLKWVKLRQVSAYYIILSPVIAKAVAESEYRRAFSVDPVLYSLSITEEVKAQFKSMFPEEFQ